MDQLISVYYIFALSSGIFCLGCLFTTARDNKNEAVRLYFLFYSAFSAFMLATVLRAYLQNPIFTLLQFFTVFSSLYILACLINKVLLVPAATKINILLLCVTLAAFVLSVLDQFYLGVGADEASYAVMLIYYLGAYIKFRKNVINENLKKAMKHTFWSMLLFVPGIALDEIILSGGSNLRIVPVFYACIGIYSVLSFLKISDSIQNNKYMVPEDLIRRFGITDREAEVMELLLKGLSYNKIADQLVISISTVRTHVTNLYKKVSVNSRYELYNLFE
ncbi:MAG TPA: LuxR C-terminal-related transcriptional regulator [Clostridia bacterium]|nr:LuxR C-terminal-related transcriptional regulator [Clostridia bacterium]